MLQSELFSKTSRTVSDEETSKNAALLLRAGFVNRLMAGVYTMLPMGLRVLRNIEKIIREEMDAAGGQEIVMPVLHPRANWDVTGRWEGMDNLFRLKSSEGKELALGPTHEEIITPLAKHFIQSYRDLPVYVYQIQTKFRDEARAKSGVLRGREFLMKDLYSFHTSAEDLERYYEVMRTVYAKVFTRMGLDAKVVQASGGTFSKYSHEFQVITPAGEDIIFHCDCGFAVNKEITEVGEGDACPKCGKPIMMSKSIEVGNIFQLNTKFSEPFNLTYATESGEQKIIYMGCYGIGLTRILGTIVEVLSDEHGMIWPEAVAPYQFHVVPLYGKDEVANEAIGGALKELKAAFASVGAEVLVDNRRDVGAGEKFADSDLIGIPHRIVVSAKTIAAGVFEVKHRADGKVESLDLQNILKIIAK